MHFKKNLIMKHLQFIFIILLITACSGTKRAIKTEPKTSQVIEKIKDSIVEKTKNVTKLVEEKKQVVVEEKQTELIKKDSILSQKNNTNSTKELVKQNTSVAKTFDHSKWDVLLKKHVSNKGNVNYKGIKKNRAALQNYITSLSENMPTDAWNKNEKLAYWINAYNAMTIDLILRHYPINSIKDIKNPWDQRFWKLGEKWYNLNEIEHDILRKMNEPRIHFGIVCASYSCPKLLNEAFIASNLETQLTEVTKGFLADPERNNISENDIKISQIFQWFSKDFKGDGGLINFLNQYTSVEISEKAKKTFKDYNWSLNE